jgi:ParB/RepB/Spo0J family partition protein
MVKKNKKAKEDKGELRKEWAEPIGKESTIERIEREHAEDHDTESQIEEEAVAESTAGLEGEQEVTAEGMIKEYEESKRKKHPKKPPFKPLKGHAMDSVPKTVDGAAEPLGPPLLQLNPHIMGWRDETKVDVALLKDIREHGQLQSILARKLQDGTLQIIAGHRRYAAMRALGMKEADMKIDVRENLDDVSAVLMALAENIVRKDLSPLEQARAYQSLKDLGLNTYQISEKLDMGETTVRERMALLELPKEIQERIMDGKIKYSCARALTKLSEHSAEQRALAADMAKGTRYRYGDWDAKNADRAVHEVLEKLKEKQALIDKYGPCPKCGSTDLTKEWGDKSIHLKCNKCSFSYNGNTKEPWAVHEIREHAEKIGLKASVTDGKVELSPAEITDVISTRKEAVKALEDPTIRTQLTVDAIAYSVLGGNVRSIKVDGDKVELKLKRDDQLHFLASPHDYQDGNHTKVTVEAGWQVGTGVLMRRPTVEKFLADLAAQQPEPRTQTDRELNEQT